MPTVILAAQLAASLGEILIMASGLMLMIGARRLALRLFLLGILAAVVSVLIRPEWLPQ